MKLRLLCALTMAAASVQAMQETTEASEIVKSESPLHLAAKTGNYPACFALLTETTWMPETLPAHALFPADAIATLKTANQDSQEYAKALKRMSVFTATFQKYLSCHIALANAQRTALNDDACTAYDIAQQNQAPAAFIELLDHLSRKGNSTITAAVMRNLNQRLAGGQAQFGVASNAPRLAPATVQQADPRGPLFKEGETIVIDGKAYVCQKASKIE